MPQPDIAEYYRRDDRYGFAVKPDFRQAYEYVGHGFTMDIVTNAQGFRDQEHDLAQPFSGKTVLLLGDSFVFGFGVNVEDRFDATIRRRLAGARPPVRVINAGVPGWGTATEVRFALDHLEAYRPDVVVLLFCGNDPANDRGEDVPAISDETSRLYYPKLLLRRHSHAYRLLLKQIAVWRHGRALKEGQGTDPAAVLDAQSASLISEDDWDRTLSLIRDFHQKLVASRPNAVLIVMASSPEQVTIRDRLASLSDGRSLLYLDLEPALAALSPTARRTPWDGHWSPAVHQIAGERLRDLLKQHGLID